MSRESCFHCFRIQSLCICDSIKTFEIEPLIVLLVHPREFMKTVGSVRIVKLSLKGSMLLRGFAPDFDRDPVIASLIQNPDHAPMILYPGHDSLNLSSAPPETLIEKIPTGKRPVIFVIDGTWGAAKNMIKNSRVLSQLPKISFEVGAPSIYQFRKQPNSYCLSTVEAVAELIENLKMRGLCAPKPINGHLEMITTFKKLITSQVEFEANPQHRKEKRFRRGKSREPVKTDTLQTVNQRVKIGANSFT